LRDELGTASHITFQRVKALESTAYCQGKNMTDYFEQAAKDRNGSCVLAAIADQDEACPIEGMFVVR
jgi:hypothetical protein